ncbi:hypothetical protein [Longispora fulva]|uniref:Uncharacterized protein n=1 Tax=Longispora fulva TaxID=619741 RepID=A0A8J7KVA4_9ACTN|nr:hypothetical protein [Longispora fulva]MBG6135062.1 hypothetical protein [Longispora fulva]
MRRLAVLLATVVVLTAGFSFGPQSRPAGSGPSTERTVAVTAIRVVLVARAMLRHLGRAVAATRTLPVHGSTAGESPLPGW